MTVCPDCGLTLTRTKRHAGCVTEERVGWMLHPFPPAYFRRVSVQALAPIVAYVGPLPQRDSELLRIHGRTVPTVAFVYVICDSAYNTLYVGKTVNPTGRLSSHRHQKPWWPEVGHLVMLAVEGEDRGDAEGAALYLETLAIRDLRPIYNIVGVVR